MVDVEGEVGDKNVLVALFDPLLNRQFYTCQ